MTLYTPLVPENQPSQKADAADWTPWWMLTWAAVVIGAILRFRGISRQSLWFDEGYTAWMVNHGPREILRLVRADTAPPLFYLLEQGWTAMFGHSEAALRSISALFSTLTLIVAVDVARRLLRHPAAVTIAIWSLALGFHQISFAQEARFYSLNTFLIVASLSCLLRYIEFRHRVWLVPLTLLLASALYTHNMMLPYVGSFMLAWLVWPSEFSWRRTVADVGLVGACVLLLYSPWAILCLPHQMNVVSAGFWAHRPDHWEILELFAWLMSVPATSSWNEMLGQAHLYFRLGHLPIIIALIFLLISMVFSICISKREGRRRAVAMVILVLLPPAAITIYSLFRTPVMVPKAFLPSAALMPLLLLLPSNLSRRPIEQCTLWISAIAMIFAAGTWAGYENVQQKEDWRGAAALVASLPAERRLIVFDSNDGQLPFDYYYTYLPGDSATGVPAGFFDRYPPRTMLRVLGDDDLATLRERLDRGDFNDVVLVASHLTYCDPRGLANDLLQRRFQRTQIIELHEVSIVRFTGLIQPKGPRWTAAE